MTWPTELLQPVPDSLSDAEAVLLEPAAIAVHAVDLAGVPSGGRVGVFGCGPLGLLIVQRLARLDVGRILATDLLEHRVEAAARMGATHPRRVSRETALESDAALDVAIEVAGTDAAVTDAIRAVRPGGRVVLVGIPAADRTSFPAGLARRKGLTLTLCRRSRPGDLERVIVEVERGALDLSGIVTDRFALSDVSEAFRLAGSRSGLKVVVEP
jgi:L-iditol 2-dehydrogenase